MGKLHKRGSVYYIDYRDANGRRRRESTGLRDEQAARQLLAEREAEVAMARRGIRTYSETRRRGLDQLVSDYAAHLHQGGRVKGHVSDVIRTMCAVLSLGDLAFAQEVSPKSLDAALTLFGATRSPTTVNKARGFFVAFFRWLESQELWSGNPARAVPSRRRCPKKKRVFTRDEWSRFVSSAPDRRRVIYEFGAATGLRRGELRQLRWADISWERSELTVRPETSKKRRGRVVPMSQRTMRGLAGMRSARPALPESTVFRSLPTSQTFRADLERAEVEIVTPAGRLTFHSLRKQAASDLLRAGVPARTVADLLGHRDISTTLGIYAEIVPQDQRQAIVALEEYRRRRA